MFLWSSAGLFGGFTPPAAGQAPVVFFIESNTTKILHFYLERAVPPTMLTQFNRRDFRTPTMLTQFNRRDFRTPTMLMQLNRRNLCTPAMLTQLNRRDFRTPTEITFPTIWRLRPGAQGKPPWCFS